MNRSAFPIRIIGVVGMVALLVLVVARPVGAFPFLLQPEPTPRPTVTAAPYVRVNPDQGIAGQANAVVASGGLWVPGQPVNLYWDDSAVGLGQANVRGDGTFQLPFTTPTNPPYSNPGFHTVIAIQGGLRAEATYELIQPTATVTPSPSVTPSPTGTSTPTGTATPVTPTNTPPPSPTFTPSPTLRPVTPMVTITPLPPTRPPSVTKPPLPTRTNTPVPGTSTSTLTPSVTPTPSSTPGPGTPSATPEPTSTPVEEISDTGSNVGLIFLWGFVLAGLLVVFRLLRVRGLRS